MQEYIEKIKISRELWDRQTYRPTDKELKMELIKKLIYNIPEEDLCKLFNIKILDPKTTIPKDRHEAAVLAHLESDHSIQMEASIIV